MTYKNDNGNDIRSSRDHDNISFLAIITVKTMMIYFDDNLK